MRLSTQFERQGMEMRRELERWAREEVSIPEGQGFGISFFLERRVGSERPICRIQKIFLSGVGNVWVRRALQHHRGMHRFSPRHWDRILALPLSKKQRSTVAALRSKQNMRPVPITLLGASGSRDNVYRFNALLKRYDLPFRLQTFSTGPCGPVAVQFEPPSDE
jgi:hypothetical protein